MTIQENSLIEQLSPVLTGIGVSIVDLSFAVSKGTRHLILIVHSPEGIGHNDLVKIHRTVQARLEIIEAHSDDISIELSTPGIERTIKNNWEYSIFVGKGIKVMPDDKNEWIYGMLEHADDKDIHIRTAQGLVTIAIDSIKKAKLDPEHDRG